MTTAGVEPGFKLVNRRDDTPDTYSHKRTPVSGVFGALAEGLGGILGGIVTTIGKVMGGAVDLAIGVFGHVLEGVRGLIRGFGKFIGSLFDKNPDPVIPDFISPIAADLEGDVKPMIDRIEGAHKEIESNQEKVRELIKTQEGLTNRLEGFLGEQGKYAEDMKGLNKQIADQKQELTAQSTELGKRLDTLETFKSGMDQRLSALATQIKSDLNSAKALSNVQEAVFNQIKSSLTVGGSLAENIDQLTKAPDGKSFSEFWQERGQTIIDMQNWYNQWNKGQWDLQKEWNALQKNWNTRVESVLNSQVKVNSDQATFNGFVAEQFKIAQWYRKNNDALWDIQQKWNDKTEGWVATQNKINEDRLAWEDSQDLINKKMSENIDKLRDADIELMKLNNKQDEYIPRKIVGQREQANSATRNDHWRLYTNDAEAIAGGKWAGQAVIRAYWIYNGHSYSWEQQVDIPGLAGTRRYDVYPEYWQNRSDSKIQTISIDYYVVAGKPRSRTFTGSIKPPRSTWHTVQSFKAPTDSTYAIAYKVTWNAATHGSRYGLQVTKNGSTLGQVGPESGLGPLTSLGNGERVQGLVPMSVQLAAGDTLEFQVYSAAPGFTQREIKAWRADINWIEREE